MFAALVSQPRKAEGRHEEGMDARLTCGGLRQSRGREWPSTRIISLYSVLELQRGNVIGRHHADRGQNGCSRREQMSLEAAP